MWSKEEVVVLKSNIDSYCKVRKKLSKFPKIRSSKIPKFSNILKGFKDLRNPKRNIKANLSQKVIHKFSRTSFEFFFKIATIFKW